MLSIASMRGGKSGDYYLNLVQGDYYTQGGEPAGQWYGSGALSMGLTGTVEATSLKNLLKGYSPDGGKALVQNPDKPDRQAGWDLTFSAPKSVSVAWSQASPEVRTRIEKAHDRAVRSALDYIEAVAGWTRRGDAGETRESVGLVFATFEHGTSRAQDPQLHTHALVVNAAMRQDETSGTIVSQEIYRHKMAAGALYRAGFACNLQEPGLGYSIKRSGAFFEVEGVSPALIKETSKRRQQIEKQMAAQKAKGPLAAKAAAFETRPEKQHIPRAILFERWHALGREYDWSEISCAALLGRHKAPKNAVKQDQETIAMALEKLTEHQSHFSAREFTRVLAEEAQGRGMGADEVRHAVSHQLTLQDFVALGTIKMEERYTTRAILQEESDLLQMVRDGRESRLQWVSETEVQRDLAKWQKGLLNRIFYQPLSDEQKSAITHMTSGSGNIAVVSGFAGTGKSSLLRAAKDIWEKHGYTVIGSTVTAKAARELTDKAGIKTITLVRMLKELGRATWFEVNATAVFPNAPKWNPASNWKLKHFGIRKPEVRFSGKTILVVDEASMVGVRDMKSLLAEVDRAKAKLVLIGDENQLQAISRGGTYEAIGEIVGKAKLREIHRQQEPWAREMVTDFAEGRTSKAWKAMDERELILRGESHENAKELLIKSWTGGGTKSPEKNLILAATNEDVDDLNRQAQEARRNAGQLGLNKYEINGEIFRKSDRILFRDNNTQFGVNNGDTGTVLKISRKELHARLDSGVKVVIPLKHYQSVRLGYAVTVYSAQGATTKNAFVLLDPSLQSLELSYVQASRASTTTRFFLDQRKEEEIKKAMEVSRKKDLASDVISKQSKEGPHKSEAELRAIKAESLRQAKAKREEDRKAADKERVRREEQRLKREEEERRRQTQEHAQGHSQGR